MKSAAMIEESITPIEVLKGVKTDYNGNSRSNDNRSGSNNKGNKIKDEKSNLQKEMMQTIFNRRK